MSRLIVISNRVTVAEGRPASTGGLAVGVLAALRERNGLWFGWSGKVCETPPDVPHRFTAGKIDYATVDLTAEDYQAYYNGFSNSVLWPLFHYRLGLVTFTRESYAAYRRVNARFAEMLSLLIKPDDIIWVHDYHLIPLGEELRARGIRNPIGFFLHTPFPARQVVSSLPRDTELLGTLTAYDVVGLQTRCDMENFIDYAKVHLNARQQTDGSLTVGTRRIRVDAFPIGIDTENIIAFTEPAAGAQALARLRTSLQNRDLIIGVDRLDYSKGLVQRFHAFERLLSRFPDRRKRVVLMQIAPPTRAEVPEYSEIRRELETLTGHINGEFAEYDWVPLRYLNRSFTRRSLVGFFRHARIGLVTPLRDGMNLVAKEFIAAQDPADPGVLILSAFAGAAEQLESAVLVNPYDSDEVAEAMEKALNMPLDERKARWRTAMDSVTHDDINAWRNRFVTALQATHATA